MFRTLAAAHHPGESLFLATGSRLVFLTPVNQHWQGKGSLRMLWAKTMCGIRHCTISGISRERDSFTVCTISVIRYLRARSIRRRFLAKTRCELAIAEWMQFGRNGFYQESQKNAVDAME